jgi:hypothetical protein
MALFVPLFFATFCLLDLSMSKKQRKKYKQKWLIFWRHLIMQVV